jgi:hypothetical protein
MGVIDSLHSVDMTTLKCEFDALKEQLMELVHKVSDMRGRPLVLARLHEYVPLGP